MRKGIGIISALIVFGAALFIGTYNYKNINVEYNELFSKAEAQTVTRQSIANYLLLRNFLNYKEIDKAAPRGIGDNPAICFPLFFIIIKAALLFSHDFAFLRLIVIIFGALTTLLVFISSRKYSFAVGIIAAALFLFHPWAQFNSSYIRFYVLWAFASMLGLLCLEYVLARIAQGSARAFHFIILALCMLIPNSIHAFGAITTLFLLCMLVSHFYYNRNDLAKISSSSIVTFVSAFAVIAIIIGVNIIVFFYSGMVAGDRSVDNVMSESAVHAVLSLLFNIGPFYPIVILSAVLLMFLTRDFRNTVLNRYFFSTAVALMPIPLFIIFKYSYFRPDYIYGMFPYIVILTALCIAYLSDKMCRPEHKTLFVSIVSLFIIISTLPTFVSNVFIDNDRADYKGVAKFISGIKDADFYSTSPGFLNLYLGRNLVRQIPSAGAEKPDNSVDEYYIILSRKGKSTVFSYDFCRLKDAQLIKIIGKDRLDLRANKIFIFLRKAGART